MLEDDLKKMIHELDEKVLGISIKVDKIHRKMRWASVFGFIKFLIIFGPLVWAYVFFQPQIQEFYTIYGKMIQQIKSLDTLQQIQKLPSTNSADLLKQLQERCAQLKQ
jgi:hypothetical protein